MTNISQFQTQEQIYDQASLWVARMERGLSQNEEQDLKLWIARSSTNRQILLDMAEQWDRMDVLSCLSEMFPQTKTGAQTNWRVMSLAASVVLVILIGVLNLIYPNAGFEVLVPAEVETLSYETAIGEQSTVVLSDGTEVLLNTNTRISVDYSEDERRISLERGEVHIDVAHNPARPLKAVVNERIVEAVGTAFNIRREDGVRLELLVTEGQVRVTPLSSRIQHDRLVAEAAQGGLPEPRPLSVSAGEEIVLGSSEEVLHSLEAEDIAIKLSWREGNLTFRGETLEEAMAEVGRYTAMEFVFLDESAKRVRVAGRFKVGDMQALLSALQDSFNISYRQVDEHVIELSAR